MSDKLVTISGAQTLYNDTRDRIKLINNTLNDKVGYATVEDGYLILKASEDSDEIIAKLTGFGGGGGGGGGTSTDMVLKTTSGWLTKSAPEGSHVTADFYWHSLLDQESTNNGTLVVKVDGVTKKQTNIAQGNFTIDFFEFGATGAHEYQVIITDAYDNYRRIKLTITYVSYYLASDFDVSKVRADAFTFTYQAYGSNDKTVHFLMDGSEFETRVITTDGRDDVIIIPKSSEGYPVDFQWHGEHVLEVYFEADPEITSNTLTYHIICFDADNPTPIISSSFDTTEIMQYSTVLIPYYVFNSASNFTQVKLLVNGTLINTLDAVRQEVLQTWSYRVSDQGPHVFTIQAGETIKSFPVNVKKLDVDVKAETVGLALYLTSENRDNSATEGRDVWEYVNPQDPSHPIRAQFKNFTWLTDGWIKDETTDFVSVMRVKDRAKITIPYQPFSQDKNASRQENGQTFEFEFKTTSVFDYKTDLISCYAGARKIGFNVTAQEVGLNGSIHSISSQYKEDELVRVSFVINKMGQENFIYCYINGIISKVAQFSTSESFVQDPAVNITIGSPDAIIDIYSIRIYNRALNRFQMINNWIADMRNSEDILKYYKENNIYRADGSTLDFDKVRANLTNLPYIVIDVDNIKAKDGSHKGYLPTYKGEKLLCNGYYVNPLDEYASFSWKNGEIDVQGTSSQAYPIKNFKLKIKKSDDYPTDSLACSGFIMTKATELTQQTDNPHEVIFKKYSMRGYEDVEHFVGGKEASGYEGARSIPTNTFVFKADFASSEGANNVELVRYYNELAAKDKDIITPPQQKDPRYRIGIDGFPMVWFGESNGQVNFIGKYNFNNHKGTDEVYGLDYHGEVIEEVKKSTYGYKRTVVGAPDESWEMCDNNSDLGLWERSAGDAMKVILKNPDGDTVQYTDYLDEENLPTVKEICLNDMFLGTYDQSKMTPEQVTVYQTYACNPDPEVLNWKDKYASIDLWIDALKIKDIYNSGDTMAEIIQEQRNLVMDLMKKDIEEQWHLEQVPIVISPAEDLLGVGGKGESVAHAFEVRFPSEWYDAWTEKGTELVKTDRLRNLQAWVASTNPETATNQPLSSLFPGSPAGYTITYNGKPYDTDSAEYRLAKFKDELDRYFNVPATILYYIYTEMFLMIDSRVKNSFPTYFAVTEKIIAHDPEDSSVILYQETGDKKAEEGKSYFKRTGEEGDYAYELYPIAAGAAPKDDAGNKLYEYVITEQEVTELTNWADGRKNVPWPKGRWCWFPYDMDTAIGINNEGLLVFSYSLEDTEALLGTAVVPVGTLNSVPVFNGASTVLWNNMRRVFGNDIQAKYASLRSGAFSYDTIEKMYEDHQNLWPAAVFNEDAYYKYIKPFLEKGEDRLGMCLGSKEQQRKWWMYNRFKFLDSKYETGDSIKYRISFRANGVAGDKKIYITPYTDIYVKIKAGEKWQSEAVKTYANDRAGIFVDVDKLGDTEAYIHSADQIKSIEKLNENLMISTFDISAAKNLQYLNVSVPVRLVSMEYDSTRLTLAGETYYKKIGEDEYEIYPIGTGVLAKDDLGNWLWYKTSNKTLRGLAFGANTLLRSVDASNCLLLGDPTGSDHATPEIDLSACEQLESCYFNRTAVTNVKLPSGGRLQTVVLPSTITTLNIVNQQKITRFEVIDNEGNWDTSNITDLTVVNVNHDIEQEAIKIINGMTTGAGASTKIVFEGFNITVDTIAELNQFINKLRTFTTYQLSGDITVTGKDEVMSYDDYNVIKTYFPDIHIHCKVRKEVIFRNYNEQELFRTHSDDMAGVIGQVTYDDEDDPTRPKIDPYIEDGVKVPGIRFDFDGWSLVNDGEKAEDILNNIDRDMVLYAYYEKTPRYEIEFYQYDGSVKLCNSTIIDAKEVDYLDYSGITPVAPSGFETAVFLGWGTHLYGGLNVDQEVDLTRYINRVINITSNLILYAQMDWDIKDESIELSGDYQDHYFAFDKFNPAGLIVTVEKHIPGDQGYVRTEIQEYTYDTSRFTLESTEVAVNVNEHNNAVIPVYIAQKVEVGQGPDLYFQYVGQILDITGMVLEITYSDDTTESDSNIEHFGPEPAIINEEGFQEVDIVYYKGDLSCKYEFLILTRIDEVLSNNSWPTISAAVEAGTVPNTWKIGDTKEVFIKKNYIDDNGDTRASGFPASQDYNFRILAFDHNIGQETPQIEGEDHEMHPMYEHTITFGLATAKDPSFLDSPLVEAAVCSTVVQKGTAYSHPSWTETWSNGCALNDVCDIFMKVIPPELKKVIKPVIKGQADSQYTAEEFPPFAEYGQYVPTIVTTQTNYAYVPSMYEITGLNYVPTDGEYSIRDSRRTYNVNEDEVCKQFDYYRTVATEPADKIKYNINIGRYQQPAKYWTRSLASIRRTTDTAIYLNYAKIHNNGVPCTDLGVNGDVLMICFTV